MAISIFDLFTIGIGPSSSHTVGPMRAANRFITKLRALNLLDTTETMQIDLYGSLALTGKGHGTDKAILLGLENQTPETVIPERVPIRYQEIMQKQFINLADIKKIVFICDKHLIFHQRESLSEHANGMRISAYDSHNTLLYSNDYFSIGGGFVKERDEILLNTEASDNNNIPYPFTNTIELLSHCNQQNLSIAQIMLANEQSIHPTKDIPADILHIALAMEHCIQRGYQTEGILPGGLHVKRRAPKLYQKIIKLSEQDPFNWLNLFALAVNEENAMGGRVVTAPTNGAAGVIPAVLQYYKQFIKSADENGVLNYLLTAAAIAILYKKGASISAAEVGCQGEIGVACSMAAGALTAVLGGSISQVEQAAEMGMEHHLGLTCDPVKGLVQIPCIERNAMAAVQAVNASKLALLEEGQHTISLDTVIATMLQTGHDMMSQYKETSLGGLAVNLPAC
jgi:L-serine dehydratase